MAYTTFHPHPADSDLCTLDTCPIQYAMVVYRPTLPGNALYLAIFAALLAIQTLQAIKYKTWTFLIGAAGGLILEIIGYAGRLLLYSNPFPLSNFLMYFIPLSIGPAFLTASIYLCLGRVIAANTPAVSRLNPTTYTRIFVSCDFLSLLLQAVGGAITSTAGSVVERDSGVNVMIAGLSFQVFSMAVYLVLWAEYALRLRHVPETQRNASFRAMRGSWRFRGFQWAIALATVLIFVRCVYRVAELQEGFAGNLAQNEVLFMILEGPMVIVAVVLMTVFHPGFAFQGNWAACGRVAKGRSLGEKTAASTSSSEEVV